MSAYGPALFISRKDGADLSEDEQAMVFRLVQAACRSLSMTNDEGDPVEPSNRGYDKEEKRALGILLYSSYAYAAMPAEIQADEAEGWKQDGAKVAEKVEEQAPGVYSFTAYGVED